MEKKLIHVLYNNTSSLAFKFCSLAAATSANYSSDSNQTGKKLAPQSLPLCFNPVLLFLDNALCPGVSASLLTVYISMLELGASTTLYRFSLNSSIPSPFPHPQCISDHQDVSSFHTGIYFQCVPPVGNLRRLYFAQRPKTSWLWVWVLGLMCPHRDTFVHLSLLMVSVQVSIRLS